MTFGPGAVIAGRYHADRLVGAGGMGEVWAGETLAASAPEAGRAPAIPGQKVALKRLLPAASQHHEVVARFRREAVLLGRIQSNYVARVYDFVDDPTFGPVLVMEFIEGPSLAHILEDRRLEVEEAVDLAVDLALALCDLHDAKIVHRDLKPGNIIMRPQPDGSLRAVIVDFGIGRQLATADAPDEITGITKANIALGTVEYMAPEQILNSRDVTPLTDVYAIGAILFRAVAGVHAFGARRGEVLARAKLIEDAPRLTPPLPGDDAPVPGKGRDDDVARELADIVARCLKKRPAQRFASARELHTAVKRLQDRVRIAELDLDSTTADGSRTRVVEGMREASPLPPGPARPPPGRPPEHTDRVPVFQPVSPPSPSNRELQRVPPPDLRGSIPDARPGDALASNVDPRVSLSGAQPVPPPSTAGRAPMPSISEVRAPLPSIPEGRASMPSIQVGGPASGPASSGPVLAGARAPMASISDAGISPPVGASEERRGVSAGTMALAVIAAFAVGGAAGVVLSPTLTGERGAASASAPAAGAAAQCPACPAAPQCSAVATSVASAASSDTALALSAAPLPSASAASVSSSAPAATPEASTAAIAHPPDVAPQAAASPGTVPPAPPPPGASPPAAPAPPPQAPATPQPAPRSPSPL